MKQAIQFGAGNIGRGFIGALLSQAGYRLVFADVNEQMIERLNYRGAYTLRVTDVDAEEYDVKPVSALHTADPLLIDKIVQSDVVTTAVGLNILPRIAPVIARAIEVRATKGVEKHLHVIACENGIRASTQLADVVNNLLDDQVKQYCKEWVGFVDCSVDRIVPPLQTEILEDVCVERFYEWNVDREQMKSPLEIPGMNVVDNLGAYVERKLFTLNTGHAILAYLGRIKGFSTIDECIADETILQVVRGAMAESGAALVAKFGLDSGMHSDYIEKIIQRFRNPNLGDKVERIGRDPIRKLSPNDRLIGPIREAAKRGLPIDNLLVGAGAAFHFCSESDPESLRLQDMIRELGLAETIAKVTELGAKDELNQQIQKAFQQLK